MRYLSKLVQTFEIFDACRFTVPNMYKLIFIVDSERLCADYNRKTYLASFICARNMLFMFCCTWKNLLQEMRLECNRYFDEDNSLSPSKSFENVSVDRSMVAIFFLRCWRSNRRWSFFPCLLSFLFYFSFLLSFFWNPL